MSTGPTGPTGASPPGAVRDRPDLYALLGVRPDATTQEITLAFRARAKELHPDRAPGDPVAAEDFKALSRAYATLRKPRSRAAYDARHVPVAPSDTSTAATTAPRARFLSTVGRARAAIVGGVVCILAGIAIAPVLVAMPTSPDTIGRDVTLWIVVAKLVICGAILVGAGWWRLFTLRITRIERAPD